ncbi:MAG: prepilin peptidase [Propionibacteriaceae bacterium]|jgi:leader peptidase (prepilin peptidase)/N-methyltransferase|nr:prepilin peptidase [Propionibacteriaceae bacterium]
MRGLIIGCLIGLGVTGFLIGLGLRTSLNRLDYRIIGPRDDERDRPHPGSRWWVPVMLGLAWFALAVAFAHEGWQSLILWLPFAAAGAWLAAVDLDVARLPDKVQGWVALYALAVGAGLIVTQSAPWLPAVAGALGAGGLFLAVHFASGGALGFGDVKLVAICGWCLGLLGWSPIFLGLIAACLLGILWALIRRSRRFAFGPWLVLGSVIAACLDGFSQVGALPFPL